MSATTATTARARPSARSLWTWLVPGLLALAVGELVVLTPLIPVVGTPVGYALSGLRGPAAWILGDRRGGFYALSALASIVAIAGVVVARRFPALATVLVILPFLTIPMTDSFQRAWLVACLAVAVVISYDAPRKALPAVAVTVVVSVVFATLNVYELVPSHPSATIAGYNWGDRFATLGTYLGVVVVAVGASSLLGFARRTRTRSDAATELMQRATEVESAAAERARLARDLHDVVAHHISLVVARADGAPFQYPGIDDDARTVLKAIGEDARGALGELRQVLAVLRRSEDADPATRAPQPTAADTLALVEQAREAGQQVTLAEGTSDVAASLPVPAGYALYRAAQEALTNARRHAPNQPVELALTRAGDVAGLTVTNPVSPGSAPTHGDGGGRGLIGMRERVEALGGALAVGASDGVFRVVATIPLDLQAVISR
ncbi:sensor histidine kinase [Luteimicrobium xylanilyticum]|uniref:sensor histidine kinase n=1 Tax=Luteimicrobium xylanilyticum TaxID=1133546 RepID=UPI0004B5326A|nr:histidine kinase [Luteimicrobium xylanilyticum]